MHSSLVNLISKLLKEKNFNLIEDILYELDIEGSGNAISEYIDILSICNKYRLCLRNFDSFLGRIKNQLSKYRDTSEIDFVLAKYYKG